MASVRKLIFPYMIDFSRTGLKYIRVGNVLKMLALFILRLLLILHGALFLLVLFTSILYSFVNPPLTSIMFYRKLHDKYESRPVQYMPLKRIPGTVKKMLVKVEDYKFYTHPGIDLVAMKNAYYINKKLGYNLYGGSTITMQLARTLFLIPRKTYLRKYLEVLIALEIDLIMKKDRILELYINYAEWGNGVYGIGAASLYHYKKRVGFLSTDELRRLVTILTNPIRYNVYNFYKNRGMLERYLYLSQRFP